MQGKNLKIIECPRDAMQGLSYFVDTQTKIQYINLLLKAGFDTLDFGSFVSPKAIPQMADTADVLDKLDLNGTSTKLLSIVANQRGVTEASKFEQISYLGFPLSVSETFQQRNTNSGIEEGIDLIKSALETCNKTGKELVVYLSMALGNPYGDDYSPLLISEFTGRLQMLGCKVISLADTVGLASETQIFELGTLIIKDFPLLEIGMHLHTRPQDSLSKIKAVIDSGCYRIDTALGGLGGCPFAEDELTGNLPTEILIDYCKNFSLETGINQEALQKAYLFLNERIIQ